ncbi:hypothetical protein ACJX0J_006080, partial [Zea mays]
TWHLAICELMHVTMHIYDHTLLFLITFIIFIIIMMYIAFYNYNNKKEHYNNLLFGWSAGTIFSNKTDAAPQDYLLKKKKKLLGKRISLCATCLAYLEVGRDSTCLNLTKIVSIDEIT